MVSSQSESGGTSRWRPPSLWKTWAYITAIYLALFLLSIFLPGRITTSLAAAVGMFVPFGVWNTLYGVIYIFGYDGLLIVRPWRILSLPLTLFVISQAERYASRKDWAPAVRVGFNLLVLFVITIAVDLLIHGSWVSLTILRTGDLFEMWQEIGA